MRIRTTQRNEAQINFTETKPTWVYHNFQIIIRIRNVPMERQTGHISYHIVTFVVASRQIRRRVPYAGHLMSPRRLWLNKIPTMCDVVVEFPGK